MKRVIDDTERTRAAFESLPALAVYSILPQDSLRRKHVTAVDPVANISFEWHVSSAGTAQEESRCNLNQCKCRNCYEKRSSKGGTWSRASMSTRSYAEAKASRTVFWARSSSARYTCRRRDACKRGVN